MTLSVQDLLTVGGALVVVLLLTQVIKQVLPSFDSGRFGALLAIALGEIVVNGANLLSVAEVRLDAGAAILTGLLAGASAAGIYDGVKGAAKTLSSQGDQP